MLTINTNLSSLIAQSSMKQSTSKLNQAIERMTTGFKINHASDNAANYSISTNMTTKIGAYQVAQDNVAMGMDLVTTASDTISLMQDKVHRLQALSIQARNGTYGAQSLNAINSEVNSIIEEINRLYTTAEYNGVALFTGGTNNGIATASETPEIATFALRRTAEPEMATFAMNRATTPEKSFISNPITYSDEEIATMKTMTDLVNGITSDTNEYSISSKEELLALANYVNSGNDTTGMTFVLGADIDLSSISNWTPIGNYQDTYTETGYYFYGNFDGNGHVIKNLTINNPTEDYQGLFGSVYCEIKNVGIEGGSVKGNSYVGGLVGSGADISNCYSTCTVIGEGCAVGGLAGTGDDVTDSYATGDVYGKTNFGGDGDIGGLVGYAVDITNCYATGNVTGLERVGGLAGDTCNIYNSYATGSVTGNGYVGGLVGHIYESCVIENCYATGAVTGTSCVGGLVGDLCGANFVSNSYATGDVNGTSNVGGLVGGCSDAWMYGPSTAENSYATGVVTGSAGTDSITNSSDWDGTTFTYDYGVANYPGNTSGSGGSDIGPIGVSSFTLQIGINGDSSCQIGFDINFSYDISEVGADISSDLALAQITDFINLLSEKQTMLGAVQNRLESALDSISVNIENLTSSRSTLRDADIAEVSSTYIQQQILQQASATLLATANQSPAIALQLI